MKVAAFLGVKDEIELIERALAHLHAVGVDEILACDMGSRDGSLQLLRARAKAREIRLVEMDDGREIDSWVAVNSGMMKLLDADWIIFVDADELLLPATGSIRPILEKATKDVLRIPRFNVPLTTKGLAMPDSPSPETYADVQLVVRAGSGIRGRQSSGHAAPSIRAIPEPKIAVRASRFGRITTGSHEALSVDGEKLPYQVCSDLLIAHLPFTTADRFGTKVENIRAFLAANPKFFGEGQARRWRRWAELQTPEQLRDEFDLQAIDEETMRALCFEGVIVSAREWFCLVGPRG